MTRALAIVLALLVALAPVPASAWSLDVHRFITDKAIDSLPPELRAFFDKARPFVVERSIDPDLWRLAGFDEEPPRHFLDLDAYGADPFPDLPRDYDRAVEKYGVEMVRRNGLLPWRAADIYGNLRRAFEEQKRGGGDYTLSNIRYYAAILSHYTADAHVPLHAVVNYDGQLTNQKGIHARFEGDLFERYHDRLRFAPPALAPVTDPRSFIFERLLEGSRQMPGMFAADRRAATGRTVYDDAYYDQFFADMQPVLERQLSAAIGGVAAMITGAWEAAGRPALPAEAPHRVKAIPPAK